MLFTRSQTSSERWTAALRVAFTLLVIVSFAEGVFAAVLLLSESRYKLIHRSATDTRHDHSSRIRPSVLTSVVLVHG